MALDTEINYFDAHRSAFLKEHGGKYALIKGKECHGFFDNDLAAYQRGVELFGIEPFLIKQVLEEDETHHMPAHFLGLLNAPL